MSDSPAFGPFALRVTACHVVTYFVAGLGAYTFLDYRGQFLSQALSCFMLPVDAPIVSLGPVLQIFRGAIFAAALFPFRRVFLATSRGWLLLWGLMVGLAVLSPTGPAPASVEGFIYTRIPVAQQVRGYFEVLPQTLAFSILVVAWNRRPGRAWTIAMVGLTLVVVVLSTVGYLAATGRLPAH
jgi:hypothetical protein